MRALVARFASSHQRLVTSIRRRLRTRLPTAHEVVYEYRDFLVISFSPDDRGYAGVFAIHAGEQGVKLYFNHAKGMPDPEKLLQGSGSQMRWMPLESASTLARSHVASLIEEAIERTSVPFASTGKGSVVIRSTSAKRRRAGGR